MTGAGDEMNPSTFREAEVIGLKYMQERKYKEALDGKTNESECEMLNVTLRYMHLTILQN